MKKVGIWRTRCIVSGPLHLPVVLFARNTFSLNLCLVGSYFIILDQLKSCRFRKVLPKSLISVSSHFLFHLLQIICLFQTNHLFAWVLSFFYTISFYEHKNLVFSFSVAFPVLRMFRLIVDDEYFLKLIKSWEEIWGCILNGALSDLMDVRQEVLSQKSDLENCLEFCLPWHGFGILNPIFLIWGLS